MSDIIDNLGKETLIALIYSVEKQLEQKQREIDNKHVEYVVLNTEMNRLLDKLRTL